MSEGLLVRRNDTVSMVLITWSFIIYMMAVLYLTDTSASVGRLAHVILQNTETEFVSLPARMAGSMSAAIQANLASVDQQTIIEGSILGNNLPSNPASFLEAELPPSLQAAPQCGIAAHNAGLACE